MTCQAQINRFFPSYDEAFGYLTSRGFLCLPRGWENGLWAASVQKVGPRVQVFVRLRAP